MKILHALWLLLAMHQPAKEPSLPLSKEMRRLQACRPAFKISPAPINIKAVWTQPFDLVWSRKDASQVTIEFTIQYAESNFFAARDEAVRDEAFNPIFNLRQRSHYLIQGEHLRLLWRESLIDSHWKRQKGSTPDLACWQTVPAH